MQAMKKVVVISTVRGLNDREDRDQNALWERLRDAIDRADSWRDHESLDQIEAIIAEIRPGVERDPQ